jgi:carboxylesterase type B
VRLICNALEDLDWAEEADIYDDAQAAIEAVKALLTTRPRRQKTMNLNKIATLTKAATADDASETDKAAVAELRKALGIDDLDTKITAEVTKAASAEDLEKVALRLAKVETTAMTNGPVRVPALMPDTAKAAARDDALNKAPSIRAKAARSRTASTAAAYMQMAREVEATIPTV